MTRKEAKLIGVTTVPNKGLEYVWYENYLKKIDEIYDSLEQRNAELEQRVKELEEPKTCEGCEFEDRHKELKPCINCIRSHDQRDCYEPK